MIAATYRTASATRWFNVMAMPIGTPVRIRQADSDGHDFDVLSRQKQDQPEILVDEVDCAHWPPSLTPLAMTCNGDGLLRPRPLGLPETGRLP